MKNHSIARDQKRRVLVEKTELKKKILKSLLYNRNLVNLQEKRSFMYAMAKFPTNSSIVRIKNRCILTGRSRSVFSLFKLSRLSFRKLASFGYIPGVSKASW
jgi:small subunit ribosomal protein S14